MAKKIIIRGFIGISENATPQFLERELKSANGGEVDLEFSSGGGFVFPGLEMANMVRNYSGTIVAKITGLAASMSSYIPMMADRVLVEDNAVFMIHNVSGFSFGDFREAEKSAKNLLAMREILVKAYANKSGKSLEEIRGLMDDESFFYGDEIVDDGFADAVIESKSDDDKDKDTSVALAQAEIKECVAQMKASEINQSDDFERAAAFLNKKVLQSPVLAGKPKQEASIMNLKELLAANPEAQAEHDALITSAKSEGQAAGETAGKKAGMDEMQKTITEVSPFLNSSEYPPVIGETALKVLKGETSAVTLTASVAAVDAVKEQGKQKEANKEQGEETPGQTSAGMSADGAVSDVSQLGDAVAQHKSNFGSGGTK